MNNENKNPNVEEELKKQSQEAAENEQMTSEASEAQENASSEEKELTAEEKLGKELEEAQKVIDEQKDKYLRLSAEFDNFRKRTLKEKAELIKNGGEKAINAILPILERRAPSPSGNRRGFSPFPTTGTSAAALAISISRSATLFPWSWRGESAWHCGRLWNQSAKIKGSRTGQSLLPAFRWCFAAVLSCLFHRPPPQKRG